MATDYNFRDGQYLMDPRIHPHQQQLARSFSVYTPDQPYNYQAHYRGPIIARTETHYLQQVSDYTLVAHPRNHVSLLVAPARDLHLEITYQKNGQIELRELTPHANRFRALVSNVANTPAKLVTIVRPTMRPWREHEPLSPHNNFVDMAEPRKAAAAALNKPDVEVFPAEIVSGIFPGSIIGQSPNYYLQRLASNNVYAHSKERLQAANPEPLKEGHHYNIRYLSGKASVEENLEKSVVPRTNGLEPRVTNNHNRGR